MGYSTQWELLDKKKKSIKHFNQICFATHINSPFSSMESEYALPRYFKYIFTNTKVTQAEMTQYFRFIKATPEFSHLMPRSIRTMVNTQTYTADLTKVNGLQLFTILILLRAVVEDLAIVRSVIRFDHKRPHALTHLNILKAAGQVSTNTHHWITNYLDNNSLQKGIANLDAWNDPTPALETGLINRVHATFEHAEDGYMVATPIPKTWAAPLLAAQPRKPRLDKPVVKRNIGTKAIRPAPTIVLPGYA